MDCSPKTLISYKVNVKFVLHYMANKADVSILKKFPVK